MTEAFRAEVRDWLAGHVPSGPLPSMDTAAGFERHREWERVLAAARLSAVTWPAAYGGRDATLTEWLVWAQAWSEPEAGSDLAGIRARGVRVAGGWLVSGTKTWSSRAAFADRAFGLFRTAARAALQVHGAIGYTAEADLSLWLAKVRALVSAWGSQAEHQARVMTELGTMAGRW